MSHWVNGCQNSFVSSLGAGNTPPVSQSLGCALELGTEQDFFFFFFFSLVLCLISRQGTPALGLIDVMDTTCHTVSSCTTGPWVLASSCSDCWKARSSASGLQSDKNSSDTWFSVHKCIHSVSNRVRHSGSGKYRMDKSPQIPVVIKPIVAPL